MTEGDIKAIVAGLIAKLGLAVSVEVSQDDEVFLINLVGSDARLFERFRDNHTGALLTAVKLLAKKQFGIEPKLIADINGQRGQKIQNLVMMAKKKAETVRVSGQEEEMPPMTPGERRAVHKELEGIAGVKTVSRGEEPHRRIVILPDE